MESCQMLNWSGHFNGTLCAINDRFTTLTQVANALLYYANGVVGENRNRNVT